MDKVLNTNAAIYRITDDGRIFSQQKIKIPLCTKGRVWSGEIKLIIKPEKELSYIINNRGYKSVHMAGKTKMVHRLVAEYFCPNPDPSTKKWVNHLDGNKLNNHYSNLEWCTIKENNDHARQTGLWTQPKGYKIKYKSAKTKAKSLANLKDKTILTPEQVRFARIHVQKHKKGSEFTVAAMAARFGVRAVTLGNAIAGKTFKNIK